MRGTTLRSTLLRLGRNGVLLLGVLIASGCASGGQETEVPSRAAQAVAATRKAAAATPPPPAEPPDDSVIYIDDGKPPKSSEPDTLVEAARRERQRRAEAGPPVATITNETLQEYDDAKVTYLTESSDEEPPTAVDAGASLAVQEEYWRSQMLETRLRWHDAVEEIERLKGEVARLQREFYATDDPAHRRQIIQPAWDLALAELEEARLQSEAARREVKRLLERGRREGALPGWLREGIELEPETPARDQGLPTVEPGEPVVVTEDELGE